MTGMCSFLNKKSYFIAIFGGWGTFFGLYQPTSVQTVQKNDKKRRRQPFSDYTHSDK